MYRSSRQNRPIGGKGETPKTVPKAPHGKARRRHGNFRRGLGVSLGLISCESAVKFVDREKRPNKELELSNVR
jgi:hypothetical protein